MCISTPMKKETKSHQFKQGDRITYTGYLSPELKGKQGTVRFVQNQDDITVTFDGETLPHPFTMVAKSLTLLPPDTKAPRAATFRAYDPSRVKQAEVFLAFTGDFPPSLKVVNADGSNVHNGVVATISEAGELVLKSGLSSSLGLALDEFGQVQVVREGAPKGSLKDMKDSLIAAGYMVLKPKL